RFTPSVGDSGGSTLVPKHFPGHWQHALDPGNYAWAYRKYGDPRYAMVYVRTLLRSRHAAWRFAFSESLNDISQQIADWEASQLLRVEEEPSPGVAGRMPRGLIESVCGTPRPGLAQVEDALPILYEQLHRGEAGFVVAYDGEKPVHVGFFGWSFD
ncbi:MAG TPA: hypothetical protein PKW66_00215, partial [Polyangiaceae bacterium]|nr:hypothetical protein [Polyangiaceae bacterium]